MNADNKKIVKDAIDSAAELLDGKLPKSRLHPNGRNPHAHISFVLKTLIGHSYTECSNSDVPTILEIIKTLADNPF